MLHIYGDIGGRRARVSCICRYWPFSQSRRDAIVALCIKYTQHMAILPLTRFYPVDRRGASNDSMEDAEDPARSRLDRRAELARKRYLTTKGCRWSTQPSYVATCTSVTGVISGKKRGDDLEGSVGRIPVVRCCCCCCWCCCLYTPRVCGYTVRRFLRRDAMQSRRCASSTHG